VLIPVVGVNLQSVSYNLNTSKDQETHETVCALELQQKTGSEFNVAVYITNQGVLSIVIADAG
jgi:hypothetical protein